MTALPALTGQITGEPRYSPATIADRIVGLNATHAILAALLHRDRSGEGQSIEIPMFETMAQFVLGDHMSGRSFEPPAGPPGYSRLLSPDRRPYRTSDGFVCALVYNDKQWAAFFDVIGQHDEAERDPRLNSIASRTSNYDFVYRWFSEVMKTRTTAEWMRLFAAADIPHAPLHDLDSLIDDPHLAASFSPSSTRPKAPCASRVPRRPGARPRPRSGAIRRGLVNMARRFCAKPDCRAMRSRRLARKAR